MRTFTISVIMLALLALSAQSQKPVMVTYKSVVNGREIPGGTHSV